jgi:hypothetical protein
MKIISFFTALLLASVCYGAEDAGKICMHIPERGAETTIVERNCKKGDIIQINKQHVPRLCDFNTAVVNLEGRDQFVCVYLGGQRAVREGTN